ncbi:lasso peptide biosynthesis B2 protein [Streptomyces telluris]|uniref:Lasso peptide biosynthesis B2 protein n=1 Tax=Streptomyces telluris TaxID=2720021 RepID=A0A9X2RLV9_9ACTN|nr:lasso peptide biosynthesis B2 protein [Streptomyces telluris]MCQ8771253.1 lasso peptide biosynthesis B2 protein [Streptomyces telluris]NJP77616.1 lasso peptide biosynthesis B2 protein [Streptomyces telluris]
MSQAMVPDRGDRAAVPWRRRPAVLLAVAVARLLVLLPPRRLRRALTAARNGAAPATAEQALAARQSVTALSPRCAGEGCLQRSVATALLCRMRGVWPDWCTGVRTGPFRAHAWVEVDGRPIGEAHQAPGYYHRLMTVPARNPQA